MKPALLVIDCQYDFLRDVSPYQCGMLDNALIGRIRSLIEFCRGHGIPVVYTQHSIEPDKSNAEFGEPEGVRACIISTKGWEIIEDLKPRAGDAVVKKDKYDAFYKTDMENVLQSLGVDTLILCGVLTNNCIRATAEGAHYRNFKLFIITDASGATSYIPEKTNEEIHDITLRDLKERMYETAVITNAELKKLF
ncbi:MAG: isochorismatase family cysteine hydrolase [bacterium]|nr:isochorismatase family cysteine hydrolase [bacterium]